MCNNQLDRFIPSRQNSSSGEYPIPSLSSMSNTGDTSLASSEHSANYSLISSSSVGAPHTRILSFHAAPPSSTATSHLDLARKAIRSGVPTTPGQVGSTTSSASSAATKRRIPTIPERVLDAPGFANDYYLNLLSWSCTNKVGIGLAKVAYVWDADSGEVQMLHDSEKWVFCGIHSLERADF
jgi:cell division cycle 20, cofactor of APC complex